ncbi:MAG: hypothetical protein JWP27_455 [Flaviaesturariibacter sp.]|nr:hypothetical protein [Flaviaesturariibacter sp.]
MTNQFSTVLFIEGHPVRYELHADGANFRLWPTENPNLELHPPRIDVALVDGSWVIGGISDRDLIAQVLEDLERHGTALLPGRHS